MRIYVLGTVLTIAGVISLFSCRSLQQNADLKDTIADDPRFAALQLTMTGNPQTGEISARFSFKGTQFKAGEKVRLAYDVISNGTGTVHCSALKRQATVTLVGEGQEGRFSTKVDPKVFESPIQPHPQGLAKFDTTRADANYNGPMQIEGCLLVDNQPMKAAGSPVTSGFSLAGAEGINGYGKICASKLGAIPAFSCLDDTLFKELPITSTTSGGTTQATGRVSTCDYPIYLPTGGVNENCKPWARLGRIKTSDSAYAAVICRRYWPESSANTNSAGAGSGIPAGEEDVAAPSQPGSWKRNPSGPTDPFFNDVAIIQQDTKTGDTCYFQALGVLYGDRVPPPSEVTLPDDVKIAHPRAKNAASFWLQPESTANINCINCHDSDPWMHSPYARQPLDENGNVFLPSKPKVKKYTMLGGEYGFANWTKSYTVEPTDDSGEACLGCHNIGSLNGCSSWLPDVGTGSHVSVSKTAFGLAFPQAQWMPPDHGEANAVDWNDTYKAAVDAINRCCNVPGAELGITGFFSANAKYGKELSPEKIAILAAAGCKVTPRSLVTTGAGSP